MPWLSSPRRSRALRRGAPLGRYVVRRRLGAGGNGTVYEAYDPELDRKVALKLVRGDFLDPEVRLEARRQLRLEAQAIARLAHPNVVRVYDVGLVGDDLFVAMERIDGPTLRQWLAAAPRSWREVVRVLRDAGEGLAAAHSVGLVHRDVKPGNVMLADGHRAVVLDFGLARAVEAQQEPPAGQAGEATEAVAACGTPAYMAPEQRRGQAVDARADQFSFCVMLYEALCGELPAVAGGRPGDDPDHPAPAGPANHSLPARLRRILGRGLATDPVERFPAMRELLDALDALLQRRRGRLLGLAAVVVVFTLTAGVVQWAAVAPTAPCADPGRALAGVWGPAQERMLRQVFLTSGLGSAQQAWRRLASQLDAYTGRWVEARRTACEATHVLGEQSAELMDLRMACLDRRKRQLAAVIDLLAEGEPSVLTQSDRLAGSLRGLSECEDTHRLLAAPAPPTDADSRQWMEETEQRLARARALEVTGRFGEALAVSREALAAGERSDYPPLVAETKIRLAIARGRAGDLEAYRQGLLEAARYAQAHRSQPEVAVAFTYLILNSVLRGEPQEAEQWNLLAEGAIEGFGGIPELDAYRLMCMSQLYLQQGRFAEAQAALQASLEVHPDPGLLELGYAQLNQGRALMGLGRLEEAGEQLDLAMESLLEAEGPGSGGVLSLHQLRGDLEIQRGDPVAAEAHYRRSLSGLRAAGNPDTLESALTLSGLGRSLLQQGRLDEAKAILQRATVAWRGGDPVDRGDSHFLLARACRRLGEEEDARREAQEARRAYAAVGERASDRLEALDAWTAQLRLSP